MPLGMVRESRTLVTSKSSEVTSVLVKPENALVLMVLGHGAGTPIRDPLMVQMAEALAAQRISTLRYNYPYSENMVAYDPEKVDSLDVLLSTTRSVKEAAESVSLDLPLFLGGRSMSSQVVSLALATEKWPDVRGVALYVFPMRWDVLLKDTVGHLQEVSAPILFVQGGRDEEYCDLRSLRSVLDPLGSRATLHVVDGADHFYDLPVECRRTREDALLEVSSVTASWIQKVLE